jgi:type IV fimbrial biogenesis protein FimT
MRERGTQRGFTLTELMAGIVIFSILISMALPSFTAWIQKSQIRTAAETIQSGLMLARVEALRRNTQVSFTMAGPDSSWAVAVVNPAEAIQARSGSEGTKNAEIEIAAGPALPVNIVFDGLGRATNLATTLQIHVKNTVGGACGTGLTDMRCLDIQVSVGGTVRMCDPAIDPATDPGDTRLC